MYVSKKLKHIRPVNRYPCGRLKLVCFSSGMFITGDPYKAGYDVIFDSVHSLYTVPGFTVYTDPIMVYAACGVRPDGIN